MRKLLAIALVTCMAASVASAQVEISPAVGGPQATGGTPRGPYAYLESTYSPYFMPMGNYGYFGVADEIDLGAATHMTGFEFEYYSRITAALLPLKADINFYAFRWESGYAFGGHNYGSYTITGLGTGSNLVQVTTPPTYLPCHVWMEVGFTDALGNKAVDTGLSISGDWGAEVGITSFDFYMGALTPGVGPGFLYWFGGYTPTLPITDPNWNPAANYRLGINVPEPVTLGLVALGGLLAVRRRR